MSNVDESELVKFSNLASEWWDGESFSSLHRINPLRVKYILENLQKATNPGNRLLDIGCGGGLICEAMVRLGFSVTGIDPCREGIEAAKQHAAIEGLDIEYRFTDVESFVHSSECSSYDIITLMEVVEHIPDLTEFLSSSCKLLKPGGMIFISTLNRTIKSMLLGKIAAEYILRMVPPGTHQWKKFVKPSEIYDTLLKSGVLVQDIKGITYKILQNDWVLDDRDISVNYILAAQKEQ
ncbi:bifunctional 2-polyprenyl-6-hydroxyphenol methylase/3-demethylubiquinol 3-O-methyltransferase UbiG [Anaplasma phagocytophilum]|uniref:bifunctional 2-polyprenyl-6-hydroxyphenol methylase/3-demethylubiquinol 3-O-methyltransferase UbiG n=1 Tax=Anaplasma phagocytophilum TaxID=948 RepID=UPI00201A3E28